MPRPLFASRATAICIWKKEETRNLLEAVDSQVAQRRKGDAVRLEIEAGAHPDIVERLVSTFELDDSLVFRVEGPVNLQRLFHLYEKRHGRI